MSYKIKGSVDVAKDLTAQKLNASIAVNIPNWQTAVDYAINDQIVVDGKLYRVITAHTSGATFAGDFANFATIIPDNGFIYKGTLAGAANLTASPATYEAGFIYKINADGTLTTNTGTNIAVVSGDNIYFNADCDDTTVVDSMIDNGILIPNWFEKSDIESMIEREISDDDWTEYLELCYRGKIGICAATSEIMSEFANEYFKVDGE